MQGSSLCSLLHLPSRFSLKALRSREKGDIWYGYRGASLHLVQLMLHWIWTELLGHHSCRRLYLLDSRVGPSWPFVFAPVTLLSKSTHGFMRTFTFMLFVCISLPDADTSLCVCITSHFSMTMFTHLTTYFHFVCRFPSFHYSWNTWVFTLPLQCHRQMTPLYSNHTHLNANHRKGKKKAAILPFAKAGAVTQSFPWLFPKLNALSPY